MTKMTFLNIGMTSRNVMKCHEKSSKVIFEQNTARMHQQRSAKRCSSLATRVGTKRHQKHFSKRCGLVPLGAEKCRQVPFSAARWNKTERIRSKTERPSSHTNLVGIFLENSRSPAEQPNLLQFAETVGLWEPEDNLMQILLFCSSRWVLGGFSGFQWVLVGPPETISPVHAGGTKRNEFVPKRNDSSFRVAAPILFIIMIVILICLWALHIPPARPNLKGGKWQKNLRFFG